MSLVTDGWNVERLLFSDSHGNNTILNILSDNATINTLTSMTAGHISGTGVTADYTGDGLRAWKADASGRLYYLYDGSDPVAELDGAGNLQATNTFGANGLVSRHTTATNRSVFYTFDERGNVAQRLDAGGTVLSTDLYDAFGARTVTPAVNTAPPTDPWGFGAQWGYQTDNETGLVLCTNRYYDPQQGRFLTRDPLGYAGGVNLYEYVGNNPTNWSDPDGTQAVIPAPVFYVGAGVLIWWYLTHNGIHPGPISWPFHNPTQTNLGPSPYTRPNKVVLPKDPTQPPGPEWRWGSQPSRGRKPGDKFGGWYNKRTGESAHPDFDHDAPIGPHWDYKPNRRAPKIRIPPGGDPGKCGPGY